MINSEYTEARLLIPISTDRGSSPTIFISMNNSLMDIPAFIKVVNNSSVYVNYYTLAAFLVTN